MPSISILVSGSNPFVRSGLGGFCFSKDLQALVHLAGTVGRRLEILKAVEGVNKQRIHRFLEKVHQALSVVKGMRIPDPSTSHSLQTEGARLCAGCLVRFISVSQLYQKVLGLD